MESKNVKQWSNTVIQNLKINFEASRFWCGTFPLIL